MKDESPESYWPKRWLARDPELSNVRIFTFGYKSAAHEASRTAQGIPEIANSLLCALRDKREIRRSTNPIILLGHSMGGLVIKKVYPNGK